MPGDTERAARLVEIREHAEDPDFGTDEERFLLSELARVEAERDRARDDAAWLRELLDRVEWCGPPVAVDSTSCPSCGSVPNEHAEDCRIWRVLTHMPTALGRDWEDAYWDHDSKELLRRTDERDAALARVEEYRREVERREEFMAYDAQRIREQEEKHDATLAEVARLKKHNELQTASLRQLNERVKQLQRAGAAPRSPSFADIPAGDPEADARIDALMAKQPKKTGGKP